MTNRRVFLGWNQPGLTVAADYLVQRFGSPGRLDMSGVVAGCRAGARSGRRLLEILVGRAEEGEVAFHPPRIETPGRLPELLYQPRFPFAGALTQQLAWTGPCGGSIRSGSNRPSPYFRKRRIFLAWLSLGEMFARLHRELAAEGLDFAGRCQERGKACGLPRGPAVANASGDPAELPSYSGST